MATKIARTTFPSANLHSGFSQFFSGPIAAQVFVQVELLVPIYHIFAIAAFTVRRHNATQPNIPTGRIAHQCSPSRKEVGMKNHILSSWVLSAVIALPGFAQQTDSKSSTQAVATPDQTAPASPEASKQKLEAVPPAGFWDGEEPNLGNLMAHPFANKKYVQRQIQPIRDRLNELNELTISQTQTIKETDTRATKGLQLVSTRQKEADQHAIEAGQKAESAKLATTQATTKLSAAEQTVGNIDQYKNTRQAEIHFRPGQSALNKQATDTLDETAAQVKDQHNYLIELRGFAPGHGQAAIVRSRSMADSAMRYLVRNHNIPVYRIHVLALGDASEASKDGTKANLAGGWVEINLLKNDVLSSVQH
jgi:outer membrane protein OmpA-like peptidoglycan-associated protein